MQRLLPCFLILVLAACSSSSGSSSGGNSTTPTATCETAGAKICERACACSTDGKCRVGTKTDAGATAGIGFDDDAKCRQLYVGLGCLGGGKTDFDYGRCEAATTASACVDAAGGRAVLLPDECK